jgi:curved DNA-binding protein CbpA
MNRRRDFYAELGIAPTATYRQIRAAYRRLAMDHHPDRHADPVAKVRAEERFKGLAEAYRVLSSLERRREYDARRSAARRSPPARAARDPAGLVLDFLETSLRMWRAWAAAETRRIEQAQVHHQRSVDELIRALQQIERFQRGRAHRPGEKRRRA